MGPEQFNCRFCLFLREHEGHYLITVQLQIQISLVCVQTDVALLLHVLVAHCVICNGICEITNTYFFNDKVEIIEAANFVTEPAVLKK